MLLKTATSGRLGFGIYRKREGERERDRERERERERERAGDVIYMGIKTLLPQWAGYLRLATIAVSNSCRRLMCNTVLGQSVSEQSFLCNQTPQAGLMNVSNQVLLSYILQVKEKQGCKSQNVFFVYFSNQIKLI